MSTRRYRENILPSSVHGLPESMAIFVRIWESFAYRAILGRRLVILGAIISGKHAWNMGVGCSNMDADTHFERSLGGLVPKVGRSK